MDIEYTCPLGSTCEEARDGKLYRCRWFIKLRGKDPQSEQELDEFRCAMEWAPVLAIEHSLFERQTGAAVESLRNVIHTGQQQFVELVTAAQQRIGKD